jgi:chromosome partitioning protein
MITVTELGELIGMSKERTKQLINEALKVNPSLDIQTGSVWKIGHDATRQMLGDRGILFPKQRVITFAALKGGIGKTSLTLNVAVRAAELGANVLIVDFDPEACATNGLVKETEDLSKALVIYDILKDKKTDIRSAIIHTKYKGIDLLPSALRNHRCEKIVGNLNPKRMIKDRLDDKLGYDLIFLELPPSYTTLTGSAYLACDIIMLPCMPNIYSYESVALTIESVDSLALEFECPPKNYRVLMNGYNSRRVASEDIRRELVDNYKSMVFPVYIRESADVENATNAGLSVFDMKSSKQTRDQFHELTLHLCQFNADSKKHSQPITHDTHKTEELTQTISL